MTCAYTDYDGDGQLGKGDLRHVINALTKHELTFEEVDFFCDKVSIAGCISRSCNYLSERPKKIGCALHESLCISVVAY